MGGFQTRDPGRTAARPRICDDLKRIYGQTNVCSNRSNLPGRSSVSEDEFSDDSVIEWRTRHDSNV
jgi:hypothetical protein